MAGFADLVRSGIALANSLTSTLQVEVTHEAWTGQDGYGKPTYAAPIKRTAIVEQKQRWIRNRDSSVMAVMPKVTILGPITDNGAANRRDPIDMRDIITLPDGTTGPIQDVEFIMDPETNRPYMYEVTLGTSTSSIGS
jgi:hypothetical protein